MNATNELIYYIEYQFNESKPINPFFKLQTYKIPEHIDLLKVNMPYVMSYFNSKPDVCSFYINMKTRTAHIDPTKSKYKEYDYYSWNKRWEIAGNPIWIWILFMIVIIFIVLHIKD